MRPIVIVLIVVALGAAVFTAFLATRFLASVQQQQVPAQVAQEAAVEQEVYLIQAEVTEAVRHPHLKVIRTQTIQETNPVEILILVEAQELPLGLVRSLKSFKRMPRSKSSMMFKDSHSLISMLKN